ncbi:PAS domain-containing protein [Variovorax paradoxus]|uniref:PAS domain-containing protein n=1 Tax=Variovorax paradoxus TaxID=34073 RepID=UPI0027825FF0|nr:PAS domain-containing protein [Variovorax paradoxus]MDQ0586875.1 PAS domain-containing protein [Variovorax paradoxus]
MTMRTQPTSIAGSSLSEEAAPLVEQLPVGLFRKDAAGRFIFVNPRFCQIKGMPADRILGRTADEIASGAAQDLHSMWRPELAAQECLQHALIMQTGQQAEREEAFSGSGDQPQCLQFIESAVREPGGTIVGTQGVLFRPHPQPPGE